MFQLNVKITGLNWFFDSSFYTFFTPCYYRLLVKQVGIPGHRKKARMARTRSDFLTRGPTPQGEGHSEEDECDDPPLSPGLPLSGEQEAEEGVAAADASHSDSEMVID